MRREKTSVSQEDYLKAIWEIVQEEQIPISARLAEDLAVTPPAVTAALKRMTRDGYLPMAIANRLMARRDEAFEFTYLHCSRQSILVPTLFDDLPQLARLIADGTPGRPLRAALHALSIDAETTAEMARAAGLDPDRPLRGEASYASILRMLEGNRERVRNRVSRETLLSGPTSMSLSSNPASGTRRVSRPRAVPTKRTSA